MIPDISSTTDKFFCHFRLFLALLTPNNPANQNFEKNEKNSWRYYHFKHEYPKWKSHDVWFLRYGARKTIFSHFGPFFALLKPPPPPPTTTQRIKILKNEKNTWQYHHFTQVYHKWQLYDIWFLRYEVHQIECFCDLGPFLAGGGGGGGGGGGAPLPPPPPP